MFAFKAVIIPCGSVVCTADDVNSEATLPMIKPSLLITSKCTNSHSMVERRKITTGVPRVLLQGMRGRRDNAKDWEEMTETERPLCPGGNYNTYVGENREGSLVVWCIGF